MIGLNVSQNIPFGVCSVLAFITVVIFNLFVDSLNMQFHFLSVAEVLLADWAAMTKTR